MSNRADREKLRALARNSAGAHQWLVHLTRLQNRKRTTKKSTLEDFLRKNGLRDNAVHILRHLEDAECGRYRIQRKGRESYFEWQVDSQAAARVSLGDETPIGDVPADAEADVAISPSVDEETEDMDCEQTNWIKHQFLLRRNLPVELCLPDNLSPIECERLSAWVKTLSFDGIG